MHRKNRKYKRYQVPRLQYPTNLKFTTSGESHLLCNGKTVQVIPSLMILPEDNPPVDFVIYGIGRFSFSLTGADVYIFSFSNVRNEQADCCILSKDELICMLKPYHYDGDTITLKLILSERGLHECYRAGAEAFFMGLWMDNSRDFTEFHNNWSVFKDENV